MHVEHETSHNKTQKRHKQHTRVAEINISVIQQLSVWNVCIQNAKSGLQKQTHSQTKLGGLYIPQ
jgi:hypothetical protein